MALAFVLLTGAGLLIRSFFQMQQVDTGFDSTNVLTAGLPISDKRFPDPAQLNAYLRQIVEQCGSSARRARRGADLGAADAGVGLRHAVSECATSPWWIAPTATPASSKW